MKRLTRAACLASAVAAVLAVAPTLAFAQEGGPRTDLHHAHPPTVPPLVMPRIAAGQRLGSRVIRQA